MYEDRSVFSLFYKAAAERPVRASSNAQSAGFQVAQETLDAEKIRRMRLEEFDKSTDSFSIQALKGDVLIWHSNHKFAGAEIMK